MFNINAISNSIIVTNTTIFTKYPKLKMEFLCQKL